MARSRATSVQCMPGSTQCQCNSSIPLFTRSLNLRFYHDPLCSFCTRDLKRAAAGAISDAIVTGRLQPSLYEALTNTGAASKHNVCILTAGESPSIGVFGGPDSEGSVLAAASQLASAAVAASATAVAAMGSAVFSLITPWGSKSLSATAGGSGQGGGDGHGSKEDEDIPTGIGAQRRFCFADPPRRVRSLCQSPGGGLVVSADSSGRVFLLDIQAGVAVVRVWKGYRGAEALWVSAGAGARTAGIRHAHGAYVAVFLRARDGLLEVWEPRRGPRVGVRPVEPCTSPFGSQTLSMASRLAALSGLLRLLKLLRQLCIGLPPYSSSLRARAGHPLWSQLQSFCVVRAVRHPGSADP